MARGSRRPVDVVVYYRCPECAWVGLIVTDKYYGSCGRCNRRFGFRGNMVTKEFYDKLYRIGETKEGE